MERREKGREREKDSGSERDRERVRMRLSPLSKTSYRAPREPLSQDGAEIH